MQQTISLQSQFSLDWGFIYNEDVVRMIYLHVNEAVFLEQRMELGDEEFSEHLREYHKKWIMCEENTELRSVYKEIIESLNMVVQDVESTAIKTVFYHLN
jgi:hypothetical protein